MQKKAAVVLTVLLLLCSLYSVNFFIKIAAAEYILHNTASALVADNSRSFSKRQQRKILMAAISGLNTAPKTVVNAERTYQLKAKLFYSLSGLEVWPVKREEYLKQAIYNNYNAININHYDLQYWLLELQMQNDDDDNQSDFFWSLANVLTLGKWNYDVLAYSSFYCVLKWKKIPEALKQPCSNAVHNIWNDVVYKKKLKSQLSGIYRFEETVEEILR